MRAYHQNARYTREDSWARIWPFVSLKRIRLPPDVTGDFVPSPWSPRLDLVAMATRDIQNRLKEKWAYIPAAHGKNRRLAVFVHGYGGNYLDTWGNLPQLLTEYADARQPFASWDYLFCGYPTLDVRTYLDISVLIATQLTMPRPVSWITRLHEI